MRMMRLASGGALAQREMQRMFAEKGIAICASSGSGRSRAVK